MNKNINYKKIGIIIFVSFLLLFITGCTRYSNSTDPTKYLEFELLDDDTYTVIGFKDRFVKNLVIPSTYNNKNVSTISDRAFKMSRGLWGKKNNPKIYTVTIEEGVTKILDEAFFECGAEEYNLANSIEYIGDEVFITETTYQINIPSNIKYIGRNAFTSATFIDDNLFLDGITINYGSFKYSNIKELTMSNYYTEIPKYCFHGCSNITTVNLPNTIIAINENAFSNCTNLKTFIIPENLKTISEYCFSNCTSLTEINIPNNIETIESYAFDSSGLEIINFLGNELILEYKSFANCLNVTNVNLNSCKFNEDIGIAFYKTPLKNVSMNEDSIYTNLNGALAIKPTSELNKYIIIIGKDNYIFSNNMNISQYAFYECNFDNLTLPNGMIVDKYAFAHANINILNCDIDKINESTFHYAKINKAYISSKEICQNAFYHVDLLEEITFKDGCEVIDTDAFVCLFELKTIYLPKTLKEIKIGAFVQCHALETINYALESGTIAYLSAGSFVEYVSNIVMSDGKIEATINKNLKIYVSSNIYNSCVSYWSDMQNNTKYYYTDSLSNHVVKRN